MILCYLDSRVKNGLGKPGCAYFLYTFFYKYDSIPGMVSHKFVCIEFSVKKTHKKQNKTKKLVLEVRLILL